MRKSGVEEKISGNDELNNDDGRNTILELLVEGLMMPNFHAQPCSEASAKDGQGEECCLPDAPFRLLCFPLVDTVGEKGCHVDGNEVDTKYFLIIGHSLFMIMHAKVRQILRFYDRWAKQKLFFKAFLTF